MLKIRIIALGPFIGQIACAALRSLHLEQLLGTYGEVIGWTAAAQNMPGLAGLVHHLDQFSGDQITDEFACGLDVVERVFEPDAGKSNQRWHVIECVEKTLGHLIGGYPRRVRARLRPTRAVCCA
jgi:hypothetical protein